MKIAQETVSELERSKKELEAAILRKDDEIVALASQLSDEEGLVSRTQKSVRDHQARLEELQEELETERQARCKAERQKSDLARDMESLSERLTEANGTTSAQLELNKKREQELSKLRRDVEEANIQHDSTVASLKKKQVDAVCEMTEQIEQLGKLKAK